MPNSTRSGDHTARQKAALEKQHRDEQKAAAERGLTTISTPPDLLDEPQELTPRDLNPPPVGVEVEDIEIQDVEQATKSVTFRVNETIEGVTIGHGNHYDFIQGQKYTAPQFVVDHLEEKGLIWH